VSILPGGAESHETTACGGGPYRIQRSRCASKRSVTTQGAYGQKIPRDKVGIGQPRHRSSPWGHYNSHMAETDKAFGWLERAYEQRDAGLPEVKTDPLFTNLHGDQRYTQLLKKLHLFA
jgi:hypothetical protein